MPLLRTLRLDGNRLSSLCALKRLESLESLSVAGNRLSSIADVVGSGSSRADSASEHRIPASSVVWPALRFLDISNNQLRDVPARLGKACPSIEVLWI